MTWNRRRLLRAGGTIAGILALAAWRPSLARTVMGGAPPLGGSLAGERGKRVALRNLHTDEHLEVEFSRGGVYVADSLAAIQVLMRDYRNGEQHVIDPTLMDILYDVAASLRVDPVFSVISGYRSPQTNEQLRERTDGVARHSLHLEGRAIDVRLAGVDCATLSTRARDMARGGVGYYRKSDFVHLDTGAFRTWNG